MRSYPHAWKAGNLPPAVGPRRSVPLFDALTATAHELQDLMASGKVKSADLVDEYIWRTEEYNSYLNAVIEYAPGAKKRAMEMDAARLEGKLLGPLHGIPILLKDSIATHWNLGMNTTSGAASLWGSKPSKNARIVDQLLEAGAVILGKATSSELGYFKGDTIPSAWSSVAGQCQSAYIDVPFRPGDSMFGHKSAMGSSSGPAVAMSAGLIPIAVGVDTVGSITTPAMRASLYSLRPTTGIISPDGIIPLAHSFDTPGILGKCVRDLADMLSILVDPETTNVPDEGYQAVIGTSWQDLRVGTLDVESWLYPTDPKDPAPEASTQMIRETHAAYSQIAKLAKSYHENVDLRSWEDFAIDGVGSSILSVFDLELESDLSQYLAELESSNVRSLQEMVDWNIANPSEGLPEDYPDQSMLIRCLNSKFSDEEIERIRKVRQEVGSSFEKTLDKYQIDVIIGPGDSFFTAFASAHNCPVAAIPLSYLDLNGRPFGLMAMARPHQESMLLKVLGAFESTFPSRQPPKAFLRNAQSPPIARKFKDC